ncbi:hypothetical protein NS258_12465 [Sphingomonas sanguinis]|uniref:Uncharacterized protein n=1 Tax=Sphingomonas sanguinis TaxID=33051 RepID=A0A147J706_9SPHN|nr:hypothetical protein NS258_12465 [Sphingomonas sanguinis]
MAVGVAMPLFQSLSGVEQPDSDAIVARHNAVQALPMFLSPLSGRKEATRAFGKLNSRTGHAPPVSEFQVGHATGMT